ncbi:ergothioneine biosynthesis glutamate--cysteine ligase EgtA [Pseudonocardia humida]|uniref:Glutamate--cysteine ligase EgtA n=1 Tax=Pseudonocardia humida TaxID=2800819 RepID=A0ABT1AAL4_9PSEU|nr:ergothioneine biosynthesis glutamate--cysteine ligase EgtA [Pseudonocardia humida]MCO1660091.1 ergothioneine biosynthesis glutamate--cysteine ligase EgtA [Pseudonocardia humida]
MGTELGLALPDGSADAQVRDDPPDAGPTVLHDCADAEAYVASVCFKHGPPRLVGVELEWLLHRPRSPLAPTDAAALAGALGPHTPTTMDPASPAAPLPEGSEVTVEPGGQLELASRPYPDLARLTAAVTADAGHLHDMIAAAGLSPIDRAADPVRPPLRILDVPRYRAMEQAFDRLGPSGRSGMCATAAVQVCLDSGESTAVADRWAALHAVGPALLAAFANSPDLHGRRTGWKSARWASWLRADPPRTAPPAVADAVAGDPAASWARRVLHSPVLCVRDGSDGWLVPHGVTFADWIRGAIPARRPTLDDLDYHVSTLFPPVRPRGHLEVRYIDAQPGRRWALPVAVLAGLLSDPAVTDRAREACEPVAGRWVSGARHGLADRVLATAAAAVFELARGAQAALNAPDWVVADLDDMIERQVLRGRCPADDPEPS